jgi:hypothetical protein
VYNLTAMKTLAALLLCYFLCIACFSQTEGKMDWGEKFNSNGATLVVKERGRSRLNGQTVITYNLFASGLPRDVEYTLWMKPVGSNPQAVKIVRKHYAKWIPERQAALEKAIRGTW